ncbi:MAG: M3 family oligoendopeptidase [Subdoligranulum sp.]|nr:M3 family oligoendopeptidase [Subdoligranulum sp.]
MQHVKKSVRLLAAVLAVCVLACGCGTSVFNRSVRLDPLVRAVHEDVDFPSLEYVRPDIDALDAKIDEALAATEKGDAKAAMTLYNDILHAINELDTMSSVASIRYDLDLTNEFYEEEDLLLSENYTRIDNRMNELTGAILDSEFEKAAREYWGEDFIERYEINSKLNSPEIEALSKQEDELVSAYQKASAEEYTTERDGVVYTMDDIDPGTDEGYELYNEIQAKRNEVLGQYYIDLIDVRMQIAHTLGYDSYTDYAYDCLGRDFTKEDAAAFSDAVEEWLSFVGIVAMVYSYSEPDSVQEALEAVPLSDGFAYLEEALQAEAFPETMLEALDYMRDNRLYDFGGGQNRMSSGYSTELAQYDAPFMFINTDYYTDPSTLFHEFGHYHNFYCEEEMIWNDGISLDLAEVHSQGLELLMFSSYEEMYGADAEWIEYDQLVNIIYSILSGCAEDSFQQAVFENPDMTLDEMNALHAELTERFMGYSDPYGWVDIHHHFETPFYYISYATSALSALELWVDSLEDREKAVEIYSALTQYCANVDYRETLEAVGLSDPFNSNCVERISDALIDEMDIVNAYYSIMGT